MLSIKFSVYSFSLSQCKYLNLRNLNESCKHFGGGPGEPFDLLKLVSGQPEAELAILVEVLEWLGRPSGCSTSTIAELVMRSTANGKKYVTVWLPAGLFHRRSG